MKSIENNLVTKRQVNMREFGKNLVLRDAVDIAEFGDLGCANPSPHQEASYCPCFTPGTLIKTDVGEIPVEEITVGMRVLTRDNGYRSIMWVGHRTLGSETLKDIPSLSPIRIVKGALGPMLPERDTVVSPQHRMLLSNSQIREWFDADEVLVAAHLLTCFEGVSREKVDTVNYIHFMFDQHEIVLADGAWSESYQPSDLRSGAMDARHRDELLSIFPKLETDTRAKYPPARPSLSAQQMTEALFSEL
jgi:hypothetical protein